MSPSTLSSMTRSAPSHKKREFWRLSECGAHPTTIAMAG